MSSLAKLFPNTENILKQSSQIPISSIKQKYVFLYFSASWCGPCRGFTPQLAEFYQKYHTEKDFEVVFVSWDEELQDFKDYYNHMPWLAVPFENKQLLKNLFDTYKVQSIPTLIGIESATGKVVSTNARTKIMNDFEGKNFPWPDAQ